MPDWKAREIDVARFATKLKVIDTAAIANRYPEVDTSAYRQPREATLVYHPVGKHYPEVNVAALAVNVRDVTGWRPPGAAHLDVTPSASSPLGWVANHLVAGMPEPLTSRKTGAEPCCDDCARPQLYPAVGEPTRPPRPVTFEPRCSFEQRLTSRTSSPLATPGE